MHVFMKFPYILFLAIAIFLLKTTMSCFTRAPKYDITPISLETSCYLPNNLYSYVIAHNPRYSEKNFNYLTELCTDTHRMIIFIYKKMGPSRHIIDEILSETLLSVNVLINEFKGVALSASNVMKLKRCLLQDVFVKKYNNHFPNTTISELNERGAVPKGEKVCKYLDSLPNYYNKSFIMCYISQSDKRPGYISVSFAD